MQIMPPISKHFPKSHTFHKFNLSNVKISYSYTNNMASIINRHNAKILSNTEKQSNKCMCRKKGEYPLVGAMKSL